MFIDVILNAIYATCMRVLWQWCVYVPAVIECAVSLPQEAGMKKMACMTNNKHQTALHLAAQNGHFLYVFSATLAMTYNVHTHLQYLSTYESHDSGVYSHMYVHV